MSKQTRRAHYNINYHFVWCPKFRRPVLVGEIARRLMELIPVEVERLGGEVLDLTVQSNYVHLFASFPPTISIAQIMHGIKSTTAYQLRQEFPELRSRPPSLWACSYYVETAGFVSTEMTRPRMDEQKGQ